MPVGKRAKLSSGRRRGGAIQEADELSVCNALLAAVGKVRLRALSPWRFAVVIADLRNGCAWAEGQWAL